MAVHTLVLSLIVVLAIVPAIFIRRHIIRARYRLDAFTPASEDGRKAYAKLYVSIWALISLALLAFFVLVPAAAKEFTQSAGGLVLIIVICGVIAQGPSTIIEGFLNGVARPISRGTAPAYRRDRHPKAFWASMVCNTALASMLLAILIMGAMRGVRADEASVAVAQPVMHG